MKKPSYHETCMTRGFGGLLVRSRDRAMNIRLALMNSVRRFTGRRQSPRLAETRTYVFIFVPFDFRGNARARSAQLERHLIDNSRHASHRRIKALLSTLVSLIRPVFGITSQRDLNNPRRLNHDLMWTWFLPNPLPPNENNWNPMNLFRFGLHGFNPNKTRRNN